jgi:hypothetical protein
MKRAMLDAFLCCLPLEEIRGFWRRVAKGFRGWKDEDASLMAACSYPWNFSIIYNGVSGR